VALLQSIAEAANSIPAVDQVRVADLQQAILSGTVKVNPHQIAQSFAELEALLV
jgi:flagellar biosynthesis anti-sigma factor FlgM